MAGKSPIEWTDQTWNPIIGCSIKSPGCKHCYAMPMAARIEAMNAGFIAKGKPPGAPHYDGVTKQVNGKPVFTGKLAQAPDAVLLAPLKRKKPTTYFVNSMGDLFHEDCPADWIDRVFAIMALSPQHTFQVLTKRGAWMREYFEPGPEVLHTRWLRAARAMLGGRADGVINGLWPLPNVWLGVSTERQQEADERIPLLLQTPAAVRFISAEPLIGPIDLWNGDPDPRLGGHKAKHTFLGDWWEPGDDPKGPSRHGVDWVICGGESGKDARPMHPDWARSLRDQCAAAGVAFFFKQWGEWADCEDYSSEQQESYDVRGLTADGVIRVGKARAGRHLDGVLHDAMPQADGRGE